MLCAFDKHGNFINLLDCAEDKEKLYEMKENSRPFSCPACKSELALRSGPVKKAYFAHLSLQDCQTWSENESKLHLGLKSKFYQWIGQDEEVKMEYYLPEIKQTPDLLINGKVAIEIQCSRLSIGRLKERTQSYQRAGYSVIWIAGPNLWLKERISPLQANLLYFSEHLGFYLWECDLKKQVLRLKYLIHQHLSGRIQYSVKEFPFLEASFVEIMRLPFSKQKAASMTCPNQKDFKRYVQKLLYFKVEKWLNLQKAYYESGANLLDESFQVQWAPPGLALLEKANLEQVKTSQYVQILKPLSTYYKNFLAYHRSHPEDRKVYSPAYYARQR